MYNNPYEGAAIIFALEELSKNRNEENFHQEIHAEQQPVRNKRIRVKFSGWLGRILINAGEKMIQQVH